MTIQSKIYESISLFEGTNLFKAMFASPFAMQESCVVGRGNYREEIVVIPSLLAPAVLECKTQPLTVFAENFREPTHIKTDKSFIPSAGARRLYSVVSIRQSSSSTQACRQDNCLVSSVSGRILGLVCFHLWAVTIRDAASGFSSR